MIENALTPITEIKQFVHDLPQFSVQPPVTNQLFTSPALKFTQREDDILVEWNSSQPRVISFEFLQNRAEDALKHIRRDLERFPSSPSVRINLGSALMLQKRVSEATTQFETALEFEPRNYVALVKLAQIGLLEGRLNEASRLYAAALESKPDDPASIIGLATIAIRMGDLEEALRLLKHAVEKNDAEVTLRYQLGILFLSLKQYREAISNLRSAVKIQVGWPSLYQGLGVAYALHGDLRRSMRSFKTALSLAPEDSKTTHGLAEVLLRLGSESEAAELLNGHLANHPDDYKGRQILARIYEQGQEYRRARGQLLEASTQLSKTEGGTTGERAGLLNNLGVCAVLLGEKEKAVQWFRRAIEIGPREHAAPYVNLCRIYLGSGKAVQALEVLEGSKVVFPYDAETVSLFAACLAECGRGQEAIHELETLIAKRAAPMVAYAIAGGLLSDEPNQLQRAIALLEDGWHRYYGSPLICNNLAYAYLMSGNPFAARKALESLQSGSEATVPLTATWGLLHLWEGSISSGEQYYKRAEKLAERRGDDRLASIVRQKMHLEMARAHERGGSLQFAREEVRRGLAVEGKEVYRRDLDELKQKLTALA